MNIFSVQLNARHYEVDFNGHVNNLVYYMWAHHARLEFLRRAGITIEKFIDSNVGPVILEAQARHLREIRLGDNVTLTCEPAYGAGRTFTMVHRFIRGDDDMRAEIVKVMAILDHTTRRLVADPHKVLRSLATRPDLLEPDPATAGGEHG
jgi:acyl-CoA thioester hydrolase